MLTVRALSACRFIRARSAKLLACLSSNKGLVVIFPPTTTLNNRSTPRGTTWGTPLENPQGVPTGNPEGLPGDPRVNPGVPPGVETGNSPGVPTGVVPRVSYPPWYPLGVPQPGFNPLRVPAVLAPRAFLFLKENKSFQSFLHNFHSSFLRTNMFSFS